MRSLPAYLDAPSEVRDRGFYEVLRYWLECTEHLVREDRISCRVSLPGNYGIDRTFKREINRFLLAEDPYGNGSVLGRPDQLVPRMPSSAVPKLSRTRPRSRC